MEPWISRASENLALVTKARDEVAKDYAGGMIRSMCSESYFHFTRTSQPFSRKTLRHLWKMISLKRPTLVSLEQSGKQRCDICLLCGELFVRIFQHANQRNRQFLLRFDKVSA